MNCISSSNLWFPSVRWDSISEEQEIIYILYCPTVVDSWITLWLWVVRINSSNPCLARYWNHYTFMLDSMGILMVCKLCTQNSLQDWDLSHLTGTQYFRYFWFFLFSLLTQPCCFFKKRLLAIGTNYFSHFFLNCMLILNCWHMWHRHNYY